MKYIKIIVVANMKGILKYTIKYKKIIKDLKISIQQ